MGFLKAARNYLLRKANDKVCENEKKKARKTTYNEIGNKIEQAKITGKYFNAAAAYRRLVNSRISKANQSKKRREQFIQDL